MLWVGYIIFLAVLPMLFNLLLHYAGGMISAVSFVIVGILILIFWTGYDNYRCRTCVPNITLGEITDEIIAQRKRSLKKDGSPYTREEIEEVVKAALCEALAVKPKDVTPEKDLVRDLGMG